MYRLVIVDDEPRAAEGLAEIFDWERYGFVIQDIYFDPIDAITAIVANPPDVVFTDIRMYTMAGTDMIRALKNKGLDCHYVLISAYEDFAYAKMAIALGVCGYIVKPFEPEEIEACVKRLVVSLAKRDAALVFPLNDPTYYSTIEVQKFLYRALTGPHFCVVCAERPYVPKDLEPCIKATPMTIQGGLRAGVFALQSKEGYLAMLKDGHLTQGVSRMHHYGTSFQQAVREAYYSQYCAFQYAANEVVGAIEYYLCTAMDRPLSVPEIADHFNFSTAYLCTFFKRYSGQTVVKFLQHIRVQYALRLILTTDEKLRDIAHEVGYEDYSYFGKVFRHLMDGQSPETFRRGVGEA